MWRPPSSLKAHRIDLKPEIGNAIIIPKSECRNPKEIRNPKSEWLRGAALVPLERGLRFWERDATIEEIKVTS
jgi:hypothetical protein